MNPSDPDRSIYDSVKLFQGCCAAQLRATSPPVAFAIDWREFFRLEWWGRDIRRPHGALK